MRGAFVVQLKKASSGERMEGSVEEVDTGTQLLFHSSDDLIRFLRERLAEASRGVPDREGTR
jgi:hypothetical protein